MLKVRLSVLALAGLSTVCACRAVTIVEDFSTNPLTNGWRVFGDTNLFAWDAGDQNLHVTWDSSQPNSYFYHPLGTTLTKADDFTVEFDLQLTELQWTNTFQLAVGLLNFSYAADPDFSRALGYTPDIFEFDYFPDSGDGYGDPNIAASMTGHTDSITNFPDFYFSYDVLPMNIGVSYHVKLTHAAGGSIISGEVLTNGQVYTTMPLYYPGSIQNFQLDTLAVSSYSGAGQDPSYAGSILAHGTVDNFVVKLPPLVRNLTGAFSNGNWQTQFGTYSNSLYTVERSTDLISWSNVAASLNGSGQLMTVSDTNAPPGRAFYRVRADQP